MKKNLAPFIAHVALLAMFLSPNALQAQQAAPDAPAQIKTTAPAIENAAQLTTEPLAAPEPINKYGRGIPTAQLTCEQVAARFELINQQATAQKPPKRQPLGQRLASGAWNGLKRGVANTATGVAVIGATIITAPAGGIGGDVVSGAINGARSDNADNEEEINSVMGTMANLQSRIETIRALNNRNAELGCAAPAITNPN